MSGSGQLAQGTQAILEVIEQLVRDRRTFTSDDIRPLLPRGATVGQIGPAVGQARRQGIIREIGRQHSTIEERKGSLIPIFEAGPARREQRRTQELPAKYDGKPHGGPAGEIDGLRTYLEERGYLISNEDLATLVLLTAARSWTILAGPSGTGKSMVVRLLADALAADFCDVQVKKNWTSSDDVLGYYSETARAWVPGPVFNALRMAEEQTRTVFVRFDEMNLAPPEFYAAELLSAGEAWEAVGERVLSAPLQLPPVPMDKAPKPPRLSNEVVLFGTLNVDETTQPLSPKVLDRSSVITFEGIDLASLPKTAKPGVALAPPEVRNLRELLRTRPRTVGMLGDRADESLLDQIAQLLVSIDGYTAPIGQPMSYRQRDGIYIALCLWKDASFDELLSRNAVVDACIKAMLLPKLQGATVGMGRYLRGLAGILAGDEKPLEGDAGDLRERLAGATFPLSLEKVIVMIERLTALGYFDYW